MQKWARMHVETSKAFVDSSAIMTQMRGDSGFYSLPPLILCWRTFLVITKHQEDGPGVVIFTTCHNPCINPGSRSEAARVGSSTALV